MRRFLNRVYLLSRIFIKYKNSYRFFLFKLGLMKKREFVVYKLFNGMKYKCRLHSSDFAILNENVIYKEYQRFFFPNLNSDSLVIDFGAQAGSFSVHAAYKYGAQVYSFEPEESNFQLLNENISLNKLDNVVIPINKAVSSTASKNFLYISPHVNQGVHSMVYYDECDYEKVEIACIDLIEIQKLIQNRRINFLKMDIEGSEHSLLNMTYNNFWDLVDCLACEYHCHSYITDKKTLDTLVADIKNLGFEKIKIVGDQTIGLIYATK